MRACGEICVGRNKIHQRETEHKDATDGTRYWLEGLMLPQYNLLQSCKSSNAMPESTRLLNQFADYAIEAMRYAVDGPDRGALVIRHGDLNEGMAARPQGC
jgi:hypothetical protein